MIGHLLVNLWPLLGDMVYLRPWTVFLPLVVSSDPRYHLPCSYNADRNAKMQHDQPCYGSRIPCLVRPRFRVAVASREIDRIRVHRYIQYDSFPKRQGSSMIENGGGKSSLMLPTLLMAPLKSAFLLLGLGVIMLLLELAFLLQPAHVLLRQRIPTHVRLPVG